MIYNSLTIILDLYKEDKISQEQASQLINDLFSKPAEVHTYPYWPQIWYTTSPDITLPGDKFPEYKITCNVTEK